MVVIRHPSPVTPAFTMRLLFPCFRNKRITNFSVNLITFWYSVWENGRLIRDTSGIPPIIRDQVSHPVTNPGGDLVQKKCTRKRRGHPKAPLNVDIWFLIFDPKCSCSKRKQTLFRGILLDNTRNQKPIRSCKIGHRGLFSDYTLYFREMWKMYPNRGRCGSTACIKYWP